MIRPGILANLCAIACLAQTEKPAALYSGMGSWRHPIATRSPEAQKYFDQGLSLTYGFNRYEAVRSFRKAAELDPSAPMVYWGISQAFGPYINMNGDPSYDIKESCAAVRKGLALPAIVDPERAWLETAATRCPDFASPAAYIAAAKKLAAAYPDDLDAQVIYAEALMLPHRWRWYTGSGTPSEGIEEATRVLEEVMRREPTHAGANHLYIHAVESSPVPERGVASSMRLMGIVPGAGHVVHMPAHIWLVLGDFETAAGVNERAAEVDRQYFARTGVHGTYYPYYLHNLNFIVYARGMQGRARQAKSAEQQMAAAIAPMARMMPDMAAAFEATVAFSRLRTNRWDEVLRTPEPPAGNALALAAFHYSRGIALAIGGHLTEAKQEQAAFEKARKATDRNMDWGTNKLGEVLDLASAVLDARVQSTPAAAVPFWKKAIALQDELGYDEPPAWYYPLRESLGAALLLSGDAPAAENVFREGLRRSLRNGRLLFGLRESLRAQKKDDAAEMVSREFETAWRGSDITLRVPEL